MKPRFQPTKKEEKLITIQVDIPTEENFEVITYKADNYSCKPPPVFILFVTLVEFGIFAFYSATLGPAGPIPVDSPFIYRPDRKFEVWRFLSYMVLHAGWLHLMFNLTVQVIVGLPLEMVHGSWRVGCIYMSGVLAGSLSTSVFDSEVYLIGASGGVYALLTAHLANVMLNYGQMQFGWMRIVGVFVIAASDVGFAVYDRYMEPHGLPVSYIAHLAGALAGITAGLLLLKNFDRKFTEHILWWAALLVYASCMLFSILYNVFDIDGIQSLEEIY